MLDRLSPVRSLLHGAFVHVSGARGLGARFVQLTPEAFSLIYDERRTQEEGRDNNGVFQLTQEAYSLHTKIAEKSEKKKNGGGVQFTLEAFYYSLTRKEGEQGKATKTAARDGTAPLRR